MIGMFKTLRQKVRQIASGLVDFTAYDLGSALNMSTKKELRKIRIVVKDLKFKKEIISLRRGFYRYQERPKALNKTAKMWRAIRIKEYFTRQDILKLSGASKSYVANYIKYLVSKGFISHVSGNGFKGKLYCLNDPDTAPLHHPIYRTREIRNECSKSK